MALQINTNVAALNAQRNLSNTNRSLGVLFEQLSSGLRVNRAADDAAGLAISEKMRAQIKGMQQGQRNAQDGISMLQTTEGALNEVHSILQRIRELSVQGGNTTLSSSDRQAIGEELIALRSEIDNIGTRTRFNGQQLLNGSLAVTLDAAGSTADTVTAVANGATVSVASIDVSDAEGGSSYDLTAAGANLNLSHDDGTGYVVSQTITVPDRCYVVVRGCVAFEALTPSGEMSIVSRAGDGELVGHVAAFTGRSTSATARTEGETLLIAIPFDELPNAFRLAPELALELLRAFADPNGTSVALRRPGMPSLPLFADRASDTALGEGAATPGRTLHRIKDEYDQELFFVDTMECPISGTTFDYLRVRTKAVRPVSRDSDFYVRYKGTDPALYSLIACPGCGYTAYRDDFYDLTDEERTALFSSRGVRAERLTGSLCGLRTIEDGIVATELALECYALRRPNERRRAVLLHRRAWAERERGDAVAELKYLTEARDAYQLAFEGDAGISDESAVRAAYLIGDLCLRLGNPVEAARWLETAVRAPDSRAQSGLVRLARERLYDARQAYNEQRKTG